MFKGDMDSIFLALDNSNYTVWWMFASEENVGTLPSMVC